MLIYQPPANIRVWCWKMVYLMCSFLIFEFGQTHGRVLDHLGDFRVETILTSLSWIGITPFVVSLILFEILTELKIGGVEGF